jgi:hypothetical protein
MPDRKAPNTSNSSRTAANVVVVLIVIANAGFVLAGLRSRSPAGGEGVASDATQDGAPSLTAPKDHRTVSIQAKIEARSDRTEQMARAPALANRVEVVFR